MKITVTTTTELNTREFNDLSDNLIESLYALTPEVEDLYDIHINYIKDEWRIDFLPLEDFLPVLNVETYTDFNKNGKEVLMISPKSLTEMPNKIRFKDEDDTFDKGASYIYLFKFIIKLYDFEYIL